MSVYTYLRAAGLALLVAATWSWAGHTVLVEGVSQTSCPACANAAPVIDAIVASGAYDVCHIAYIYDRNPGSIGRVNEFEVAFVPHYFFDGGVDSWIGSGDLPDAYVNRIAFCLARPVPDLVLTLRTVWEADAYVQLTASLTNRGDADYRGRLRMCLVERQSRWLTTHGEPYRHAMIGPFAINQELLVPAGEVRELTGTWDGLIAGFANVTRENLLGVAFVTAHDTGYADAATEAPVRLPGEEPEFLRGDANADGKIDIADAVRVLAYLFGGGQTALVCLAAGDANDDGKIDISDAIKILGHLFAHTGPLPPPFGACGPDPTPDALTCVSFPPCAP